MPGAVPDDGMSTADSAVRSTDHSLTWADRFRGAMLGGAVGDALGAAVRTRSSGEIQRRYGNRGLTDYEPLFGRRGGATDLTQLTVFTLEALLRAKAINADSSEWLPTPIVRTNHLRWLHTQGVPWDYAMAPYVSNQPEPTGWLLQRPELFSTRNPGGAALQSLSQLALCPAPNDVVDAAPVGNADCVVWAAPAMLWHITPEVVFAAGADIARLVTADRNVHGTAGLHADVLGQLMRGHADLWRAVSSASAQRLASLETATDSPDAVRRAVHAAMFVTRDNRRPQPSELDAEFDTVDKPGEWGVALSAVAASSSFPEAVLLAANQSADSSVTAALAGQLAGALYGVAGIPEAWLDGLELRTVLETLCADATEAFAPPPPPPPLPQWAQRYVGPAQRSFTGPLELGPASSDEVAEAGAVVSEPAEVGSQIEEANLEPDDAELTREMPAIAVEPLDSGNSAHPEVVEPEAAETAGVVEIPEPLPEGDESASEAAESISIVPIVDAIQNSLAASVEEPEEPVAETGDSTEDTGSAVNEASAENEESTEDENSAEEIPDDTVSTAEPADNSGVASEHETPAAETPAEETAVMDLRELERALSRDNDARETDSQDTDSAAEAAEEPATNPAERFAQRVLGCLLGGALGDALGSNLEFCTADQITERCGPQGPDQLREAYGVHGAITDDTQMTLFTAEGLIRASVAQRSLGTADYLPEVQLAYQRWLHTQGREWKRAVGPFASSFPQPDGWLVGVGNLHATRAPGKTVFSALETFASNEASGWMEDDGSLTVKANGSKGCGGVMRAAPAALYSTDPAEAFRVAARTAALTHGHASGYLSAGALAVIVQQALLGYTLDDGVWLALQVLETWEDHEETSTLLKLSVELAEGGEPEPAVLAEVLGGGWVGEEALAIAVCAALVGGSDVRKALRVAVHHSGDSDSTGAVCGNIVGALYGVTALPADWLAEVELHEVIRQVGLDCVTEFGSGAFVGQPDGERVAVDRDGPGFRARYPVRWLPWRGPSWGRDAAASTVHVSAGGVNSPNLAGDLAGEDVELSEADTQRVSPEDVGSRTATEANEDSDWDAERTQFVTESRDSADNRDSVRAEHSAEPESEPDQDSPEPYVGPETHGPKPAPRRFGLGQNGHSGNGTLASGQILGVLTEQVEQPARQHHHVPPHAQSTRTQQGEIRDVHR